MRVPVTVRNSDRLPMNGAGIPAANSAGAKFCQRQKPKKIPLLCKANHFLIDALVLRIES